MENSNSTQWMIALVAIVAVVSIVTMTWMGRGTSAAPSVVYAPASSSATAHTVAGQAYYNPDEGYYGGGDDGGESGDFAGTSQTCADGSSYHISVLGGECEIYTKRSSMCKSSSGSYVNAGCVPPSGSPPGTLATATCGDSTGTGDCTITPPRN